MERWKSRGGKSQGGEEKKKEDRRRERVRRKKWQVREKVGKSPCVSPMICGSVGFRSRLAKVAGAEPAGQMRDEKLHSVVARRTCPNQNVQSTPFSDHFWKLTCQKSARHSGAKHMSKSTCTKHATFRELSWHVEKVRAVAARSTFPSQNAQSTSASENFWKLRCLKSAHCCGTQQTSRSKCTKHNILRPLLEVDMLKECTPYLVKSTEKMWGVL